MPIVSMCSFPGCVTKTIGPHCVEHDLPVLQTFPRGRPSQQNGGGSTVTLPGKSLQAAAGQLGSVTSGSY